MSDDFSAYLKGVAAPKQPDPLAPMIVDDLEVGHILTCQDCGAGWELTDGVAANGATVWWSPVQSPQYFAPSTTIEDAQTYINRECQCKSPFRRRLGQAGGWVPGGMSINPANGAVTASAGARSLNPKPPVPVPGTITLLDVAKARSKSNWFERVLTKVFTGGPPDLAADELSKP